MLLLPEVFLSTWGDRARPADGTPPDDSPFWPWAIARGAAQNPDICLLAEAYWDLEWPLMQQGFDLTYDKRLYDRLRPLARVLRACAPRGRPRVSVSFRPVPRKPRRRTSHGDVPARRPPRRGGHHLSHAGPPVLPSGAARRPAGPPLDPPRAAPTTRPIPRAHRLLRATCSRPPAPESRQGDWRLLECREAWPGNPTWDRFLAFTWERSGADRLLVVANYGPTQGQCFVPFSPPADPGAPCGSAT